MTTIELKKKISDYKKEAEFARQMANDYHRDNNFYDESVWSFIAAHLFTLANGLENILNHRA